MLFSKEEALVTDQTLKYLIKAAAVEGTELRVEWGDGHASRFHAVWLRHQCSCAFCGTPVNAVRGIRLHHLPEDLSFGSVSGEDGDIVVRWRPEDHLSHYSAVWLRDNCYEEASRTARRPRPRLWDGSIGNRMPTFDVVTCEASEAERLAMLEAIHEYGFCKVENAPRSAAEASRLIAIVGPQRQSHYGTYTLSKKAAVDNVGDTTGALDPHCDETYRLSTVGITVFQVITPSTNGGHSTLVDGFEAVRLLRKAHPEDFDLLTKVPITGCRRDAAQNSAGNVKWYTAAMPAIRTDFDGAVCGVRLNERQIMPLDLPHDLVEPTYRALKRLYGFLYKPELRLTIPLSAGEGLIFDNQRVLHGRTAFEPEEPARSVLTSSVDIEEFHSAFRLLHEKVRGEPPPVLLRQGMVA